jgi:SPASM domain peptide maturase of grasp-with-spasm system
MNYVNIYPKNVLVSGYNRCGIINLNQGVFHAIPIEIYNILNDDLKTNTLENILFEFNENDKVLVKDFINHLCKNNILFLSDEKVNFRIDEFESQPPFFITNISLEFDSRLTNFKNIINQIEKLNCKNVEIRFHQSINIELIFEINSYIENINSTINSLDFIISNFNYTHSLDEIFDLIIKYPRITNFIIFNQDENECIVLNTKQTLLKTVDILRTYNCGIISSNKFVINTNLYSESLNHNSCLNKKISIDKDGNIKNCPSMPQSFGNIKDTTLEEALNHPDFKKYWNVNKDMIDVCKDCEFRHICTDCRAYTERNTFDGDIDLSKPLKCGYNPYTNEWAEWSTNPLIEKAIEYYGMQDLVKKDA